MGWIRLFRRSRQTRVPLSDPYVTKNSLSLFEIRMDLYS